MRLKEQFLRFVLSGMIADENQKLLLKLEELTMSSITAPLNALNDSLTTLGTKLGALVDSNATLSANAVTQAAAIATLETNLAAVQADLTAAQANSVDPADAATLAAISQKVADIVASLP